MFRKLHAAALAIAVAGGVYLAGVPAEASNMGFKLERSFKVERDAATGRNYQNRYFVSFPLFNGLDPDLANTADASSNKCVGDPGPPAGPAAGDGILNADDAICDMWTSRQGTFTLVRYIEGSCVFDPRIARKAPPFNNITFTGNNPPPLDREVGYQIEVAAPTGMAPENRAVIVGSHDPSFAGKSIALEGCRPAVEFVNVPYHTQYTTMVEVLCGLEGVDWMPRADGWPDSCDDGTFYWVDADANGRHDIVGYKQDIDTWDNVQDGSRPCGQPTDNTSVFVTAVIQFGGVLNYAGCNADLVPGDSYVLRLKVPDHQPTLFRPPHF